MKPAAALNITILPNQPMSSSLTFGASTWLWTSPLTTAIAGDLFPKIRDLGFGLVEIPVEDPALLDVDQLRGLLEKNSLQASVCGAFGPGRDLTHPDAAVRAQSLAYIDECLAMCQGLGATFFAGPMYSQVGKVRQLSPEDRQADWDLAVAGLRQACELAAARGLSLAIEPLNRFESDLVNTAADAVNMARDIGHPAARVMLDSFHMTIEEKDLAAAIEHAGDLLIHVQVSENHRGIPGTGLTDWAAFARGLKSIGYDRAVAIESFTPENRDLAAAVCIWKRHCPDQDTFAREGLRFLKQALA